MGVLPLAAAAGFAPSMQLAVLPLADGWARRRMLLVTRGEPQADSALAALVAHLAHSAAHEPAAVLTAASATAQRGIEVANDGRERSAAASAASVGVAGSQGASVKRKRR